MITMFDNQGRDPIKEQTPTTATLRLVPGYPVFDVNGHKLGTVDDPPAENGALILREGHIFPKDVAIPLMAVRSVDATGVYLAMAKDDVQQERWDALATLPAVDPGIVMRGTTDIDTDEQVIIRGTTVIDPNVRADAMTHGTTVVDHNPSEMTRGTTVRDTGMEHAHPGSGTPGEHPEEAGETRESGPGR